MASLFSRWFGGGRRWNAFEDRGGVGGGAGGSELGGTAGTPSATGPATNALSFDYAPLPKERISGLRALFTWNSWMGISIIQYLFILAYCLVGIFVSLAVAQALMSGSAGYAILYLVLAPVWLLILTMVFRLVSELAISVLMAPHLLNQNHKDLLRILQEQQAQLSAAGQQQLQPTHCPESELEAGQRSRPGSGSFRGVGGGGRRSNITAGDVDEEEVGIHMASV